MCNELSLLPRTRNNRRPSSRTPAREIIYAPQQVEELKKSAARAGAITALTRAKAWEADLDPEDLAIGCPSVKEDGSPFSTDDFAAIAREMRPLASKLAEETNLSHY